MATENDISLEAEQQVLADCFDPLENATVEHPCDAGCLPTRVRTLDLDSIADERLKPYRRAMEGVTFRHSVTLPETRGDRPDSKT